MSGAAIRLLSLAGLCALLLSLGCGPGIGPGQAGPPPGETITCNGSARLALDCSSEVSYQGLSGEAGITVFDVAGMEGKFEQKAIRRVSEEVKQFIAVQTRACRDYNACILDAEQYRSQAAEVRRKLTTVPVLLEALKSSKTEAERQRALDELYRGIVPDDKRVEEITFNMTMTAKLPRTLGGESLLIPPGGAVPSGAKVAFSVAVSKQAYVYMFQTTPTGQIASVLFPDPRIGTQNPLRGGSTQRIPDAGKSFKLDSEDLGQENIYLVVSQKPIDDLDAALNKVKSKEVSTLSDSSLLQRVATVVPRSKASECQSTRAFNLVDDAPSQGCSLGRGLELDESDTSSPASSGAPTEAMAVRTAPGDDLIVRVFPFNHVTLQKYRELSQLGGPAPKQSSSGSRGIVIIE